MASALTSSFVTRKTAIASSSLLALSAALAWSGDASAAGTCGAPNAQGVVNCAQKHYPNGIFYAGVDDLTINVGSFAGQNGHVSVGDLGITAAGNGTSSVNVGKNVTIAAVTYSAISAGSYDSGKTAQTSVVNYGVLSSAHSSGINAYSTENNYGSGKKVTGSATTDVTNGGNIAAYEFGIEATTTANASGSEAATAKATTNIFNSGDITDTFGTAILVSTYAIAYGDNAYTIAAGSVTNSGKISTVNPSQNAIEVQSQAIANSDTTQTTTIATAASTVNNSAKITTTGDGSMGIDATSTALSGLHSAAGGSPYLSVATATSIVNNSGAISTIGNTFDGGHTSYGIYVGAVTKAYGFRNAYATSIASVTNSGAVTTSGFEGDGIAAKALSSAYGAKGCMFCFAGGYTIGRSYATVTNSGAVKTSGDYAAGISALSSGYAITKGFSYSYSEAAIANSGTVATAGKRSDGISAVSLGWGAFRYFSNANVSTTAAVNNSGKIATSGDYSAGIYAWSSAVAVGLQRSVAYANTFIANTGDVSTAGVEAADIHSFNSAYSVQGDAVVHSTVYITNGGTLTTAGEGSNGILSVAQAYSTMPSATYRSSIAYVATTVGVVNGGSITTSGAHANGIEINSSAVAQSYYYSNVAANVTVVNSGAITTTGDYSSGIAAKAASENITRVGSNYFSQAVAVTTVQNSGTISVSGKDAAGISAFSYAAAFGGSTGTATATANVINTGSISASAQYADGVAAISVAQVKKAGTEGTATATTYVANAGSIAAKNGTGISAQAFSYDQDGTPGVSGSGSATASVVVKNGGTIVASEEGIFAEAAFDGGGGISTISTTATVENTGSITVTGDHGVGIGVLSGGLVAPGAATVVNAGTVTALGAEAAGVYVSAYTTTIVNAAGGVIDASGAGGIGVRTVGPQSTVATYAGSTISGGTGVGAAGVYMHGVVNVIGNSGTITSANDAAIAMYAYAANVVKNTGTITGTVTMTTGAKGQNVLYNYGTWNAVGGNSSFTHGTGGGSNLVNEKGGTIVVVGSQTLEGLDTFTNLGLVTMTQAASANLGSRPAFETLTVSGDYDGIGGALAVDASTVGGMHGDELVIDGAATGTTKIMPTIVGTPGATTGNGILLVSAHSAAGASNFVLAGNAANGDEVAGAFEYNLAFDPGNGTSGKWYLQSQLYPGVYQFGQVQSAAALVSDQVNPSLDDLMSQAFSSTVASASLVDTSQQVSSNDSTFVPAPNGAGLSGWGRFDEARFNVDPTGSPFADYKLRVDSMQIGLDGTWHNAGNLVMFGGYITPFHAWSDFASFGGHIGMSGTAYGLYGLWFSGPWQAGLRLNIDDATAHFTDTFIGTNASVKPYEKGVQAAVSYDMPLDWADFTPSAEFNYGTVNGVHFTDGAGDLVQLGSTDDVWGKLNGRFSWDVETAHNLMVQPYVNLGVLYRGDSSTRTAIGAFATSTNVNGWDGDLAVGVNTNLAANLSLSTQADYLAGDRVKGWTGFIGLRYTP